MVRRFAFYGVPFAIALIVACGSNDNTGGHAGSDEDGGTGSTESGSQGTSAASSSSHGSSSSAGGTSSAAGSSTSSSESSSGGTSASSMASSSAGGSTSSSMTSSSGSSASTTTDSGSVTAGGDVDVLQYHKHINRDGFYVDSAFTEMTLKGATLHLDSTFDGTGIASGAEVRASPLYASSGYGGNPSFYVTDELDNVYAFDGTTGMLQKTVNLGTGVTSEPCGYAHKIGIRGTPAIDTASGIMVLDAATGGASVAKHTIYGLKVSDLSTAWSLDVTTLSDPVVGAFVPGNQNERGGVLMVNGIAYVVYGGFIGDCGDYHGWIVGVPAATGKGAQVWASPSEDTGIWAPGGAASDGTNIYAATGNSPTTSTESNGPNNGVYSFALIRFQAGPVFSGAGTTWSTNTKDYWRAVNDMSDDDLGGSSPLLVTPPGQDTTVVQLGKDGYEYVLDATKSLGGSASPNIGSANVMNGNITGGPGSASVGGTTYVYMVGNSANGANCAKGSGALVVTKLDVTNATTPISSAWCADPGGGGSPIVTTSDGTNDAMVWVAGTTTFNDGTGGDNQIHAFDLASGTAVLAGSDTFANVRHFSTPIVVNGRIVVAGDSKLYAYKP